ncbi:MAG TPA: hypothetical protein VM118_15165, partial [Acidobacteriota bacterium]|nr:hypothetical protein [Acidobacteriota bacterium]
MKTLRTIYEIARADFHERTRRFSFVVTLALVVYVAYLFVPPNDAVYTTLQMGNHRGIYNSAWIGAQMALLAATYLIIVGFYLVRNSINRDLRTHVGEIIAATRVRKPVYTLGKMLSNFGTLAVIVGVVALSTPVLQLIRGEDMTIRPLALIAPFLYLCLSAIALVAAMAVLFECIPFLRGTLGNIVYFLVIPGMMAFELEKGVPILGINVVSRNMMEVCHQAYPDYVIGSSFTLGGEAPGLDQIISMTTFTWNGMTPSGDFLLNRLMWIGIAVGITMVAGVFFNRFDSAGARSIAPTKPKRAPRFPRVRYGLQWLTLSRGGELAIAAAGANGHVRLTPLPARRPRGRFLGVLRAELRLAIGSLPWWWQIGLLGLIAAQLATPWSEARQFISPVAWLWPILIWSSMGIREHRRSVNEIVFSAPHPLRRQLPAVWIAGVAVALFATSGMGLRTIIAGEAYRTVAWLAGAVFVPSLALALGTWSRTSRLFEIIYLFWWYIGPANAVGPADYTGMVEGAATPTLTAFYGLAA